MCISLYIYCYKQWIKVVIKHIMATMSMGSKRSAKKIKRARTSSCGFKDTNHLASAFSSLNDMRRQNVMCDVVLVAGATEIPCHKVVLCACSQYFYAMFTGKMVEAKANRIDLKDIDPLALVLLIEFVYTSEIQVTEENVQTLLPAASILQMSQVRDACCNFLHSQLNSSNALGIKAFADIHSCSDLFSYAMTYCEEHFTEIIGYEEYLSLPVESVCTLICSDELVVTSEEQVFEAVMSWVNHDRSSRQEVISQLMENVRLPLMSQEYLVQHVEEEPLMKANSRCKDFLLEAMKFHLLKGEQKAIFKTPRTIPRTPPKVILVIGGEDSDDEFSSVEFFYFKEDHWHQQLAQMPSRRCGCGVAVVNGMVYVVGGFDERFGSLATNVMYNPSENLWKSCEAMNKRREFLGVAVLNDLVYAVGGFDLIPRFGYVFNSAECYDVQTGEWFQIANMSTKRHYVAMGVLNGFVYAVGGHDGLSALSSVERYNPVDDVWTTVSEMSCRRSAAGVGVIDGVLYAVGGRDGQRYLKSIEMYNHETNTWTPLADMQICRDGAGVVSHNGLLYVVGGRDSGSALSSVECYDPKKNMWTLLPSSMMTARAYPGVVLIDRPSYLKRHHTHLQAENQAQL
ncbi:kelch-like protein 3 isoform X3 [Dreissena polymorpha]|uniref:kelch-like protein 3 isoform X3 n=1 Tax=Dreissena polymorpha TaxID=45954 RepID=UPI00226562B7|nr:kelch-like protein 3 isoform X3 [Dreissena polymorpha]